MSVSDDQTQEAQDFGEYDEPNLTEEECWDLALDNARICVENDSNDWAHSYLLDVQYIREQRDRAREVAVALEQQNAEALRIAQESTRAHEDGHPSHYTALMDVQRVLEGSDDDK